MSFEDYTKACRLGRKAYQRNLMKGVYPYLQALDETISHVDIISEVDLGLQQIPAELIAGTRNIGRRGAFAPNYMPLLDVQSEFASKWIELCKSHLEEGIHTPVTACEFMGRFYIMEGNKRVSVLKYFGSPTIPGIVTRLVPRRTLDEDNQIYYEYMNFHRLSGVNYILFSRRGGYPALSAAVAGNAAAPWSEEMRQDFSAAYVKFSTNYKAKGGQRLPIEAGDALLAYIEIYGYDSLKEDPGSKVKENIAKSWDEFARLKEHKTVELVMDPVPAAPKKKLIDILLPPSAKQTKIAFIHFKNAELSSWTYAHELGQRHVAEVFGDRVETFSYENITPGEDAQNAIQRSIDNGCTIIFTTTPEFISASIKMAREYPNVKVLNCSLNTSHHNIRSYYGRMYEAKFLCGMIAGALADNNRIGYIADYPIYGTTANINAFALGARMVNPRAKVYLRWSTKKDGIDITDYFRENQISYLSHQDMIVPRYASRRYGLYRFDSGFGFGPEIKETAERKASGETEEAGGQTPFNAATPLWNWGRFYEKIIESIMAGSWNSGDVSDAKALNYWWGLSAGMVDLIYTQNLSYATKRLVEFVRRGIETGTFHPFSGLLYSQTGIVQKDENRALSPEEIITMDWLAENVVGEIPDFDSLTGAAQAVVRLQGIRKPEDAV